MLVKNEEDRLPLCLPPLKFFREILIYDSGSLDKSLEICMEHGAKIIKGEWLGFSETRRKLFQSATQPWIFWLDADEVLTDQLAEQIIKEFTKKPHVDGFEINRLVSFEGKWIRHGDWFPDWNLRLFRASSWQLEDRPVHEQVTVPGETIKLEGLLHHHSYRNWADRRSRSEKYASLWAQMKRNEGKKARAGEGVLRALWNFLRGYFIKLGFLDGKLGFLVACSNSKEVLLKYENLKRITD
jgi:(heptosyl)LPS beta-1,4-glucosyltransferase